MIIQVLKCNSPAENGYAVNDIAGQGFSFPSLHAVNSSILFTSLALYIRKNWFTIVAIVLIALVGISRLYNGVHYPTDILAGWCLGLFSIVEETTSLEKKLKQA